MYIKYVYVHYAYLLFTEREGGVALLLVFCWIEHRYKSCANTLYAVILPAPLFGGRVADGFKGTIDKKYTGKYLVNQVTSIQRKL